MDQLPHNGGNFISHALSQAGLSPSSSSGNGSRTAATTGTPGLAITPGAFGGHHRHGCDAGKVEGGIQDLIQQLAGSASSASGTVGATSSGNIVKTTA